MAVNGSYHKLVLAVLKANQLPNLTHFKLKTNTIFYHSPPPVLRHKALYELAELRVYTDKIDLCCRVLLN